MNRPATCGTCGKQFPAPRVGPLPHWCPQCRAARHARAPKGSRRRLAVTCWCEETVVYVSAADVAAGLTGACRSPRCVDLDRQERGRRGRRVL